MADEKVSGLDALDGADVADADEFLLVDKSDTSMAATGTNKKITAAEARVALRGLPGWVDTADGPNSITFNPDPAQAYGEDVIVVPAGGFSTVDAFTVTSELGAKLVRVLAGDDAGFTFTNVFFTGQPDGDLTNGGAVEAYADNGGKAYFAVFPQGSPLGEAVFRIMEGVDPTPLSNQALIYARDNGSGSTQLMVMFGDGVAVELGTEGVASKISDTAYAGSWNGVTTIAPSKNAVYDKVETLAPLASPTFTGTPTVPGYLPLVAAGASVENIGAVEFNVNTVATTGATETLDTSLYDVHDCTMDQACTFTFSNPAPSGKATTFVLILRGAFTPTFPASVDWADATPPTYTTPSVYTFTTVDAGTTWLGTSAGKAFG